MGEYKPTGKEVRESYESGALNIRGGYDEDEFDRWVGARDEQMFSAGMEQVRAELAKVTTERDAALAVIEAVKGWRNQWARDTRRAMAFGMLGNIIDRPPSTNHLVAEIRADL